MKRSTTLAISLLVGCTGTIAPASESEGNHANERDASTDDGPHDGGSSGSALSGGGSSDGGSSDAGSSDAGSSGGSTDAGSGGGGSSDGATAGGSTDAGDSGSSAGDAGNTITIGAPGCGLAAAAFCDTFDGPSTKQGRAGELDTTLWSAGRLAPQLPSGNGVAIGIGPATLPRDCRADLPASVDPSREAVICNPGSKINSNHLLVAAAAQNYGQSSFRIRQPFDFAGRTGKIVFDAEAFIIGAQLGWASLAITEDPINAPSFSIGETNQNNNEGSLIPRNAIEFHFRNNCAGYATPPAMSVGEVIVFKEYEHTVLSPNPPSCVVTAQGKLNHFEIDISQQKVDIYVSDASADGVTFAKPKLIYSTKVDLPFTRGYVHLSVHNHATLKYSDGGTMDAWIARFDNMAFDGPVLSKFREYEIPDALTPGMGAWNRGGPVKSVGYRVADVANGPSQTLIFKNVDLTGVTRARISASTWYNTSDSDLPTLSLRYRLNGGAWRDRMLSQGERWHLTNGHSQGQVGQMLDVPLTDLVKGDNKLEFVTKNVGQGYAPLVANIDLVLATQ